MMDGLNIGQLNRRAVSRELQERAPPEHSSSVKLNLVIVGRYLVLVTLSGEQRLFSHALGMVIILISWEHVLEG